MEWTEQGFRCSHYRIRSCSSTFFSWALLHLKPRICYAMCLSLFLVKRILSQWLLAPNLLLIQRLLLALLIFLRFEGLRMFGEAFLCSLDKNGEIPRRLPVSPSYLRISRRQIMLLDYCLLWTRVRLGCSRPTLA